MTTAMRAVTELMTYHSGSAVFVLDENGDIQHQGNQVTVKMEKGETIDAFLERLKRDGHWRAGDALRLLNNGGRLDVAQITRQPIE